jgi:hypothetical protein
MLAVLTASLAMTAGVAAWGAMRTARTKARLDSAATRLALLTDVLPGDGQQRASIVWGYSERLRLGLESPFRLIEASSRDPRLTDEERRTVSWALLARVLRGETHRVEPAALDLIGPWNQSRAAVGEQHLSLITRAVADAADPRSGELAVRLAYTLASAERTLDGSATLLAAEAAAMVADRELARREATAMLRSVRGSDPVDVVRRHRARLSFYVERPVLLAPDGALERAAIPLAMSLLDSLRVMRADREMPSVEPTEVVDASSAFAASLMAAAARVPPMAPLAVTVQRYLPLARSHLPGHADALKRVRNGEMLVAAAAVAATPSRVQRRALGRLLLAAAVSARSTAQEPVWFPGDSGISVTEAVSQTGLAAISFDSAVPAAWRPYFVRSLAAAIGDARRVLPALRLDGVHVRFRMDAPADSALAMHDPRTRTVHLPVTTAAGTLIHELAHDLDRQSARQQGVAGYRSDNVTRGAGRGAASGRVAASLRALTLELGPTDRGSSARADRPAEIFATRVDWFVSSALARQGIASGFLSAVQDEVLTGHVVHPERLRTASRSRSLITALDGMSAVAPFAASQREPTAQAIVQSALALPLNRRSGVDALRDLNPWQPLPPGMSACDTRDTRVVLLRLAADSRARGWLRSRARWIAPSNRPAWARSVLQQIPWAPEIGEHRVSELRERVFAELALNDADVGGLIPSRRDGIRPCSS